MAEPEELRCQELVELVTDYLEDCLTVAQRGRFEAHIAGCGNCAIYLDQMRATISLTGRLTPEDLTPGAERALVAAFRRWKSG